MKNTNFYRFKGLLFFLSVSIIGWNCNQNPSNETTTDLETQKKVQEIMSRMDLTDKVGEMTQLAIDMISVGGFENLEEPHQLDTARLRNVLLTHRVGSILNVGGHAYTREHWKEIMTTIQDLAVNEKASKIPVLYGIDAIHGANYTLGSTLFPQQITLAASWNPTLARTTGEITAYETRASYIPWTFSPVNDIGRDPRWPRLWETFGEDVHLASVMGAEIIKGYQGEDISDPYQIAACMKHFLGYSTPATGKDRTPAYIPERQLREYHVPSFQAAVDAGAKTIMICSGEINGVPVHGSKWILTDLLRNEMGFKGVVVTDWRDIKYLFNRHFIAKDYKEAIKIAINAGIDMSMVPDDTEFPVLLKELVEEGEVPMSRIDEAVARILTLKVELGLFDDPMPDVDYSKFASAEHAEASYQAALECITLLKNENNILPIAKKQKVLVTGPTANSMYTLNGGWSRTWQGTDERFMEEGKLTIVDAIRAKIGDANVLYEPGVNFDQPVDIAATVRAAKQAGLAVICIGEMPYTENVGTIDDLTISQSQIDLVNAIAATGTPMVLVLIEGRPRVISAFADKAQGIVHGYLPGNEGGRAIAEVLFGDYNPNGKLPYTYPRHVNALFTYDHKYSAKLAADHSFNGYNPQFEFGHGLSYTTFAYSDLKLSAETLTADGTVQISVKVTNTGDRAGKEVVQLYIRDLIASISPSVKRLRGFEKIDLAAGASKTVTFDISSKDLAFIGIDNKWVTEPGEFEVQIGGLTQNFTLE